MNKMIILALAFVGICFMGFKSYNFIVNLQVENAALSSSLQKQNEALKALSLQKEVIEVYNAKSLSLQEDFLKAYEKATPDTAFVSNLKPDEKSHITLQEIENAITIFYSSSP